LGLPDLEHAKAAVLNSLTSADAQPGYRHAIDEFVDWYCSEPRLAFNRILVLRYRSYLESRQLAPGTVNLRLGAVRRLAYETADCGLLSSDLAAGIRRVKGVKKLGVRLGNWLTVEQAHSLWQAPDSQGLKGKRDRASRCCRSSILRPTASWPLMTCVGRALVCATLQEANWKQIQLLLGHVSVQITERYLGCKQRISIGGQRSHRNRTKSLSRGVLEELPTIRELQRGTTAQKTFSIRRTNLWPVARFRAPNSWYSFA
jgi:integrase